MTDKKKFETQLSRRIMGPTGEWLFFCRNCGRYRPETDFYKKRGTTWGIDSRCREHYDKTKEPIDPEMSYLKLDPLKETDFKNTQELLMNLGYTFNSDLTIHQQFCKKHNLKEKENETV